MHLLTRVQIRRDCHDGYLDKRVQGWNAVVSEYKDSLTWNHAIMCLSDLGEIVSGRKGDSYPDAEDGQPELLDANLQSLLSRLEQQVPGNEPASKMDGGLLGAGLMTAVQLQTPRGQKDCIKTVLQRHGQALQEVLLNQSHAYLSATLLGRGGMHGPGAAIVSEVDAVANIVRVRSPRPLCKPTSHPGATQELHSFSGRHSVTAHSAGSQNGDRSRCRAFRT
jgi:hypothetical protein